MLAVVGDGRSGDPLHERDDKRDVYEGEVAKVDSVSELVRRVDGVVDGLRSLVDVARGSVGGVCSNVFEEVEERFAHPSVRVHHERDEFLMHRRGRRLVLVVLVSLASHDGVAVGGRVALAGSWLAHVVDCRVHDVGDGDVCEDISYEGIYMEYVLFTCFVQATKQGKKIRRYSYMYLT